MAAKAALAAALSWLMVLPFGGAAEQYAYYAPLGAVVAVSATLVNSVRVSAQSIGAILMGAVLAYCAGMTALPEVMSLALVVGLGVMVAGWNVWGANGSWVPIAALFVLIIGGAHRDLFIVAYIGLTSAGAIVGIAVNAVLPPLPLTSAGEAVRILRRTLADQLEDLAEGLAHDSPPTVSQWNERKWEIGSRNREMRDLVLMTMEARSANWRARRWQGRADNQHEQARALQRLALVVEGLTLLVVERERADLDEVALGPPLRGHCARAFRSTAAALRQDVLDVQVGSMSEAKRSVDELAQAITDLHGKTGDDLFAAGAIVTALRQVHVALRTSAVSEPDVQV